MTKFMKIGVFLAFIFAILSVVTSLILAVKSMKYREIIKANDQKMQKSKTISVETRKKIDKLNIITKDNDKLKKQTLSLNDKLKKLEADLSEKTQEAENQNTEIKRLNVELQTAMTTGGTVDDSELVEKIKDLQTKLLEAESKSVKTVTDAGAVSEIKMRLQQKEAELSEYTQREESYKSLIETLKSQITQLKDIREKKRTVQRGAEGVVEVVNSEMKFIVFNMGEEDGIKLGDELGVYRGDQLLGTVIVDEVFQSMGSASVTDALILKNIKEGDVVKK